MKEITIKELFDLFPNENEEGVTVWLYETIINNCQIVFCGPISNIPEHFKNRVILQMDITYEADINIYLK